MHILYAKWVKSDDYDCLARTHLYLTEGNQLERFEQICKYNGTDHDDYKQVTNFGGRKYVSPMFTESNIGYVLACPMKRNESPHLRGSVEIWLGGEVTKKLKTEPHCFYGITVDASNGQ